jgi:hypothetical protein
MAAAAAAAARVVVSGAGSAIVNAAYARREAAAVPRSFALVCRASGWDSEATWSRLNGERAWWEAPNGSYLYFNRADGQWWLDSGETGLGVYVARAAGTGAKDAPPPRSGWAVVGDGGALPLPTVVHEAGGEL